MPFAGSVVRAPVMAAKYGMPDAALSGVNDQGTAPLAAVAAGSGAGSVLSPASTPSPPAFSALPALGQS